MTDRSDTPSRLVVAAERLFAEGGDEATSLRAVARAAHANAAAVHYHFGGRHELLRAVVARHLEPLAERQLGLLDQAGRGDPPDPAGVLEALIRPQLDLLAKLRKRRVGIAQLVGREMLGAVADPAHEDRTAARALALLRRALPDVPAGELAVRLRLVRLDVAALFVAAWPPEAPGPLERGEVDGQVARMVAFAVAGLRAPTASVSRKRRKAGAGPGGR